MMGTVPARPPPAPPTQRARASLVMLGHVDSGKSTLTARLLQIAGRVEQDRAPAELWRVVARSRAELERAITMRSTCFDCRISRDRDLTVVDTGGHGDFQRTTFRALSLADNALVVVAAAAGEFEAGICEHGQTRRLLIAAYVLGVRRLVIAVSKLDHPSVAAIAEQRYAEIVTEVEKYLRKVGWRPLQFAFVPISALAGHNVAAAAPDQMPWHDGPTLLDLLRDGDRVLSPAASAAELPLRMPIERVQFVRMPIVRDVTVAIGRVQSGVLRVGDRVAMPPSGMHATVRSIHEFGRAVREARPGDYVGVAVDGGDAQWLPAGGALASEDAAADPVLSFEARVIVLEGGRTIRPGYQPMVHCHAARVPCTVTHVLRRLDKRTGSVLEESPAEIRGNGDAYDVGMVPLKPMYLETFRGQHARLGRLLWRDMRRVVAGGIVTSVDGARVGGMTKSARRK